MDLGDLIMKSLKTEGIRENLFPINYYILKGIYDKNFYKRSKYLIEALIRLYDSFATNLDLSIFDESIIIKNYSDKNLDLTNIANNTFLGVPAAKASLAQNQFSDFLDKENNNNFNFEKNLNADFTINENLNNYNNYDNANTNLNSNNNFNANNFSVINDSVIMDLNNLKPDNFKNFHNMSIMTSTNKNININSNNNNNNNLNTTLFADPNETILFPASSNNNNNFNNKNNKRDSNAFGPNDTLNITINKYNYANLSHQMTQNKNFYLDFILNFHDEHILDKEENYPLLNLVKNYIFSDEDPASSTLLITYSLFASSVELIFCLKQAEKLPNIISTPCEKKFVLQQNQKIKMRIRAFLNAWLNIKENKSKLDKKKNEILKILLKQELEEFAPNNFYAGNETNFYFSNTIFENPLIENYISITRIIKDQTPFYFNTLELARQICLIDHENFCRIKFKEFSDFVVKGKISESFEVFRLRDLQLKCYILSLYYKQDYLDKKKEIIKHLIILAKILKGLKNFQTCFTIISVLIKLDIVNKKDIWRSLERYERDLFRSLRDEYINMENNSGQFQIINFVNPNFVIANNNNKNANAKSNSNSKNNSNQNNQNANSNGNLNSTYYASGGLNNNNNIINNANIKNLNNSKNLLNNLNENNTSLIFHLQNNNNNNNYSSKNSNDNINSTNNNKDLNSSTQSAGNDIGPSVPNINLISNINSYFFNRLKLTGKIQENMNIAKEYKFFIQDLMNKRNFKYSFHKVNPIYDFFSFGFIEILRLVKFKKIINYNPENPDFEKIYEELVKKINEKKK